MRCFLERAALIAFMAFGLAAVPLTLSYVPAGSMPPQSAAVLFEAAQLVFYKNTGESTWAFDGHLAPTQYDPYVTGPNCPGGVAETCANGQALHHIPDLSFAACIGYTLQSWGQMLNILRKNAGPPYGPSQSAGGCSDSGGNPPDPASGANLVSCDNPYNGGNNFAGNHINSLVASTLIKGAPGTTCTACSQGPYWYPCQVGLLGCGNPPSPGSCTPARFH